MSPREFRHLVIVETFEVEAQRLARLHGMGRSFGASHEFERGNPFLTFRFRRGLVTRSASGEYKLIRHSTSRIYQNAE